MCKLLTSIYFSWFGELTIDYPRLFVIQKRSMQAMKFLKQDNYDKK